MAILSTLSRVFNWLEDGPSLKDARVVRRQIRLNREPEINAFFKAGMKQLAPNTNNDFFFQSACVAHLAYAFSVSGFALRWGIDHPNTNILLAKAVKVAAWQPSKSTPGNNQIQFEPICSLVNLLVTARKRLTHSDLLASFDEVGGNASRPILEVICQTLTRELSAWMGFAANIPKEEREAKIEALSRSLAKTFCTAFNCEKALSPAPPLAPPVDPESETDAARVSKYFSEDNISRIDETFKSVLQRNGIYHEAMRTSGYKATSCITQLGFAFPVAQFALKWGLNHPLSLPLMTDALLESKLVPDGQTTALIPLVAAIVKARKDLSHARFVEILSTPPSSDPSPIDEVVGLIIREIEAETRIVREQVLKMPEEEALPKLIYAAQELGEKFARDFYCTEIDQPAPVA